MLTQFNFKNHKSFYNKAILDLSATTEKRHLDNTVDINGNKILPVIAIHGANASGKSTVIDAFYSMAKCIVLSFDMDQSESFNVVPFAFNKEYKNSPSEFEVCINLDDYEYRYGFSATKDGIIEEWLYKKIFKKGTRAKERILFQRTLDNMIFNDEVKELEQIQNLITNKTLLLGILGRRRTGIAGKIYTWFVNIYYMSDTPKLTQKTIQVLHENKKLFKRFKNLLNEIDPCLKDISISLKEDENQKTRYNVYGVHIDPLDHEQTYELPIMGESTGTIKLIMILPIILTVLEEGSLLFIDELDTQLHPLLLKKIIYMFNDININKKYAQLVFTSHNTLMFKSQELRRDQLYLVEKNKTGESQLYSLSDFKKLRHDADYEKKYLAGEVGAIPFLQ